MIVIGVCGKMNSGKGVVAEILEKDFEFVQMALADPIKIIIRDVFDISNKALWGSSDQRPKKVREMLQTLGTEWGRHFDEDVWTKHLIERLKIWDKKGVDTQRLLSSLIPFKTRRTRVIVPDVRFPNEAALLKKHFDATMLLVDRPSIERSKSTDKHKSETAIDEIVPDEIIINDKSLKEFTLKIFDFAARFKDATDTE